jgi:D-lyxose ketol-isomerase
MSERIANFFIVDTMIYVMILIYQDEMMTRPLLSTPPRRSEVNRLIDEATRIIRSQGFALPPFSAWSPREWQAAGAEWDQARLARLGWDVTDFGLGDFSRFGRVLFTLRNGTQGNSLKPYAEKIILGRHGQRAPAHYHLRKVEDIINRGGGEVVLRLNPIRGSSHPASVYRDGREIRIESETLLRIQPGESVCLPPGTVHQFWGEETKAGEIPLIGEVSSFCDDVNDNVFLEEVVRFPRIVEDEPARFSLCHELPEFQPTAPAVLAAEQIAA